jgi:hypothetical protein
MTHGHNFKLTVAEVNEACRQYVAEREKDKGRALSPLTVRSMEVFFIDPAGQQAAPFGHVAITAAEE